MRRATQPNILVRRVDLPSRGREQAAVWTDQALATNQPLEKDMALTQLTRSTPTVHIRPSKGIRGLDLAEIWRYRDLLYFLVRREIKVRYTQSVLGIVWALIQPAAYMVVFTILFGNMVKIQSDGAPYAVFSYTAMVPWAYFSSALATSTNSLIQNMNMVTKTYFPRVFLPASAIAARIVDFGIAMVLVFILMAWFKIAPTIWIVALPWLMLIMILSAAGLGMGLSAVAVRFRDVTYAMPFAVHLLMYAAPVVYPASLIPDRYRLLYGLNPMVGVIEGFRSALLGTNPMPWDLLVVGSVSAVLMVACGVVYFRSTERIFADVV